MPDVAVGTLALHETPEEDEPAVNHERRVRRSLIRAKIFLQDLLAGKPDVAHAKSGAEAELDATVHAAPVPGRIGGAGARRRDFARRGWFWHN